MDSVDSVSKPIPKQNKAQPSRNKKTVIQHSKNFLSALFIKNAGDKFFKYTLAICRPDIIKYA